LQKLVDFIVCSQQNIMESVNSGTLGEFELYSTGNLCISYAGFFS